jgi:hypothetical protein
MSPKKTFSIVLNSSFRSNSSDTNLFNANWNIKDLKSLGLSAEELASPWNMRFSFVSIGGTAVAQANQPYLLALQITGAGNNFCMTAGASNSTVMGFLNVMTDTTSVRYILNNQLTSPMLYYDNLTNVSNIRLQVLDITQAQVDGTNFPYVCQLAFTQI